MAVGALGEGLVQPVRARAGTRVVRLWLYGLIGLVILMVAIGGATRLTGSGLSITEWKPVTGAIPPLSDAAWAAEFGKYRASSQYQNLNRGMALGEFKTIYWWEWSHRQLGRAIGLAFFVPLVAFWWRRTIGTGLALRLLGVGALGGLQAAVGWIMVASGLQPGMTAVAPIKLMLHLVLAGVILVLLVWIAVGLAEADRPRASTGARAGMAPFSAALLFLLLVMVQVALGGLVAGSRAGWTYNTWPLMDGRFLPPAEALFPVRPWLENVAGNPALVQLQHRLVAYLVVAAALAQMLWLRAVRPGAPAAGRAVGLAGLTFAQMALGIATLILVVPLWAGLAHQLLAMALLIAAASHARLCREEGRLP